MRITELQEELGAVWTIVAAARAILALTSMMFKIVQIFYTMFGTSGLTDSL